MNETTSFQTLALKLPTPYSKRHLNCWNNIVACLFIFIPKWSVGVSITPIVNGKICQTPVRKTHNILEAPYNLVPTKCSTRTVVHTEPLPVSYSPGLSTPALLLVVISAQESLCQEAMTLHLPVCLSDLGTAVCPVSFTVLMDPKFYFCFITLQWPLKLVIVFFSINYKFSSLKKIVPYIIGSYLGTKNSFLYFHD